MAKAALPAPRHLRDFKPGTLRGAAGFVRAGQTPAGQWWLLDARNRPFFSRGVTAVNRHGRAGPRPSQPGPYELAVVQQHGADDPRKFASAALARLRAWHCNTLGPWSAPELCGHGLFFTETIGFRQAAPESTIKLGGALLPDVFDPRWVAACDILALEMCASRRNDGELLGYFTDHGLQWAQPSSPETTPASPRRERPTLLQICLSLEPGFPAYHAAWEFALAPFAGDLSKLAAAWGIEPNKQALRQLTLADTPLRSDGYRRDHERFTREFARRYVEVCTAAIRRHDGNHLVLGAVFDTPPAAAVLAAFAHPAVDVLAMTTRTTALFGEIDDYARANAMPVLITEFSWTAEAFLARENERASSTTTTVERMLARGRAAFSGALEHPALVGCLWSRWADQPGDLPPFGQGLVHLDDREAREHSELFAALNAQAEKTRRRAESPSPTPHERP